MEVQVGAIIVATGYDLFDATRIPEYGYGRIRNVVTALEFERFLSASGPTHGHVYRPSDMDLKDQLPELEKQHQKAAKVLEAAGEKIRAELRHFLVAATNRVTCRARNTTTGPSRSMCAGN